MYTVMTVCTGNICRSPMAEFVFREMAEKRGMGALFHAASAATSGEDVPVVTENKYFSVLDRYILIIREVLRKIGGIRH